VGGIDTSVSGLTTAPRDEIFGVLADPTKWPDWIGPVVSVEPHESLSIEPVVGAAWHVEVGVKIGPFKKTSRVRIELVDVVAGEYAIFRRVERQFNDEGAQNAPAPLLEFDVRLTEQDASGLMLVATSLRFDGKFPPGVESIVTNEMRRTIDRLSAQWGREF
jgi:hypothetical protein